MPPPRVAFFPDSFHEVNGVAHTARNFQSFATRRSLPFLCIRAAPPSLRTPRHHVEGSIETLDLPRSRAAIGLERDLSFDPLFPRYAPIIGRTLLTFRPDIIHITGPSELGIFGAYYAWRHKIPLAASWHTNVHEYAAQRLTWLTRRIGGPTLHRTIENTTLAASTRFYGLARVLFAPNPDLCCLLEKATNRPCHLMQRGVDTDLFSPTLRTRTDPDPFTLGFVGRLSVEKNVALLPRIAQQLHTLTNRPIQFVLIGHGAEEPTLRQAFHEAAPEALFPGVLRGPALAAAYADMDLFLFPSHTDTFGNVVLEALASGVPALVTPDGGPAHIVRDSETGHIVPDDRFAPTIAALLANPTRLATMRQAARAYAETCSWDAVFDRIYTAYTPIL
jgi:glycosyltransferase involved in cell wall biosynthesis